LEPTTDGEVDVGVGRFVRLTAGAVALGLVMQMLPVDVGGDGFGTSAANADPVTPTPPPAAVNPTDSIRTVLTPGPTQAPSQITTDTVWGPQGSPYLVQSLNVAKGASLTLLPGAVVKMNAGAVIVVHGQLLSLGTPQRRVTVTSIRDDTATAGGNPSDCEAKLPLAHLCGAAPCAGTWSRTPSARSTHTWCGSVSGRCRPCRSALHSARRSVVRTR
jgi:hypothetical protein